MKVCLFDGCGRGAIAKGLCGGHYGQRFRGESLRPLQKQFHGMTEYQRLMARTAVGGANDCWAWLGSRNVKNWHGQWRNGAGEIELVHRAAWRLMKGEIPRGMFILHHCDNPICVNPAHLFMGNQSDNMRDMWGKARARPGTSRGEKHGMSKVTKEMVLDIRSSQESGSALAVKYGITPTTVCDIRKRRTWKHI